MKIVGISDLHGDFINVPPCDVVCIAGDIVPLRIQRNIPQSEGWLKKTFIPWAEELPCKKVLVVGGNHDFVFDTQYNQNAITCIKDTFTDKVMYIDHKGVIVDDKVFFGDSTCTGPAGWAFYKPDMAGLFDDVPNCDVLITHQPPYGEVGTVLQKCWNYLNNFGSEALAERLMNGGIKYCLSGHIHSGLHSSEEIGNCICYNVSIKDEDYNIAYTPIVLDI